MPCARTPCARRPETTQSCSRTSGIHTLASVNCRCTLARASRFTPSSVAVRACFSQVSVCSFFQFIRLGVGALVEGKYRFSASLADT